MSHTGDVLAPLVDSGEVGVELDAADQAIKAVHRRPVNLRKYQLTASESLVRGAKGAALLHFSSADSESLAEMLRVYGLLTPESIDHWARVFLRAPLQVCSHADILAGGPGRPVSPDAARRLELLSTIITHHPQPHAGALTQVVHAEIAAHQIFGSRSLPIALVLSRLCAIATGFDPRGLAVPEGYLHRHRQDYAAALEGFPQGSTHTSHAIEFLARAWTAGAEEAEGIARAAS